MKSTIFCCCLLTLAAATSAGDSYPDVFAVERTIAELDPSARVQLLGRSREGRPILSVLVGLDGDVPLAQRPRILIVAGLRADHRVGTAVACALWPELKGRAGSDAELLRRLATHAVEILPLANPDGLATLLGGAERRFATNTRPVDRDRDGVEAEDGPVDLDGDGRITWIRVPREGGSHGISSEDPRLLVPAGLAAGVRGTHDIYPEGLDRDGDGEIAEDGTGGVDLDRNFPYGWVRGDKEAGRSPPSEPESRALADHLLRTPRIACVLVLGGRDNLVEVPPANRREGRREPDGPHPEDLPWMQETVRRYRAATGARGKADDAPDGAFHQWAYFQRGIPAFSTPVFHGPPQPEGEPAPEGAAPPSEDASWLAWSDTELDGRGFKPWRPFDHPTLGPVEIGGFAPLLKVNPPASHLPVLTARHAAFVGDLLALLPSPVLVEPKAVAVARGVYELRATIRNDGVFPVITAMGRETRAPAPIRVELDLPADRVLTGARKSQVDCLDGFGGHREFVWLIRGKPKDLVRVRVAIDSWGELVEEVEL